MKIVMKKKNDMRKIFLVLALLMTAFTAISQKFSAVCESGQTLYYNIIDEENHYVELRREGYQLFSGDIIIPGEVTYNGTVYTVKGIGSRAYYDCEGLTSVVIPNTITYIGESAFNCCLNLTSVNIPESVENIGPLAFSSTKINEIYIPRSVKNIGYSLTILHLFISKFLTSFNYSLLVIFKILFNFVYLNFIKRGRCHFER